MADSKKYDGSQWEHSLRKLTTATADIEPTIYTDGTAITAYTLKGNTVQSGTPTPSSPITISGVGNKTANLLNIADCNFTINSTLSVAFAKGTISFNGSSGYISSSNAAWKTNFAFYLDAGTYSMNIPSQLGAGYARYIKQYSDDSTLLGASATSFTLAERTQVYFAFYIDGKTLDDTMNFMLAEGSRVQDFEPVGLYKIPISSNGVTTPIYLNEPLMGIATADEMASSGTVTRAYKKVVLNSNTIIGTYTTQWGIAFVIYVSNVSSGVGSALIDAVCSHYGRNTRDNIWRQTGSTLRAITLSGENNSFLISDPTYTTLQDFKDYIGTQYNNGTPITVIVAVTTPTTETVTAPSIPTTEGANTITVDTTVQPSEFTATWTGWHNASVKEKSENLFDGILQNGYYEDADGTITGTTSQVYRSFMLNLVAGTYTISFENPINLVRLIKDGTMTVTQDTNITSYTVTSTTDGNIGFSFRLAQSSSTPWDNSDIMLNSGQTALPYAPYWE